MGKSSGSTLTQNVPSGAPSIVQTGRSQEHESGDLLARLGRHSHLGRGAEYRPGAGGMGGGGLVLRGRFALTFWGTLGDVVACFEPRWRDPTFG